VSCSLGSLLKTKREKPTALLLLLLPPLLQRLLLLLLYPQIWLAGRGPC
jgi:hypothetical protein